MKKINSFNKSKLPFIAILGALTLSLLFFGCAKEIPHKDYIRLHIRADSNDEEAQAVKLKVRDAIVAHLTLLSRGVSSREEMKALILNELPNVERIANDTLKENGYDYSSTAYLGVENFPEKSYGDLTLEEGEYEALIVALGSGKGNNWWCVAYPPLCFIAAEDNGDDEIKYRSVIADFFKNLGKGGEK